jgi:hypothetical protein
LIGDIASARWFEANEITSNAAAVKPRRRTRLRWDNNILFMNVSLEWATEASRRAPGSRRVRFASDKD